MVAAARNMSGTRALMALLSVIGLGGCDLHRENSLRATLSAWFQLGDTLAFDSRMRCTAAVFRVRSNDVGTDLPMAQTPAEAQEIYRSSGLAGIRMEGQSPHQLTDTILLANDGWFGKHALGAAAQVGPCLDKKMSIGFRLAMTRPGAVLAYSADLDGVMILDPVARKLFFAAGDTY